MDPESFDPDDILDAASLLQFGFTLTTLSDWSLEVLEAWLIDIKDMLTVDGFDAKQVRTVLVENHTAPLQHVRARELSTRELSTQCQWRLSISRHCRWTIPPQASPLGGFPSAPIRALPYRAPLIETLARVLKRQPQVRGVYTFPKKGFHSEGEEAGVVRETGI